MRFQFQELISDSEMGGVPISAYPGATAGDLTVSSRSLEQREVFRLHMRSFGKSFESLRPACASAMLLLSAFPDRMMSFSIETDRDLRTRQFRVVITVDIDAITHEATTVEDVDGRLRHRRRVVSHFVDPVSLATPRAPEPPPPPKERRLTFRPRDIL